MTHKQFSQSEENKAKKIFNNLRELGVRSFDNPILIPDFIEYANAAPTLVDFDKTTWNTEEEFIAFLYEYRGIAQARIHGDFAQYISDVEKLCHLYVTNHHNRMNNSAKHISANDCVCKRDEDAEDSSSLNQDDEYIQLAKDIKNLSSEVTKKEQKEAHGNAQGEDEHPEFVKGLKDASLEIAKKEQEKTQKETRGDTQKETQEETQEGKVKVYNNFVNALIQFSDDVEEDARCAVLVGTYTDYINDRLDFNLLDDQRINAVKEVLREIVSVINDHPDVVDDKTLREVNETADFVDFEVERIEKERKEGIDSVQSQEDTSDIEIVHCGNLPDVLGLVTDENDGTMHYIMDTELESIKAHALGASLYHKLVDVLEDQRSIDEVLEFADDIIVEIDFLFIDEGSVYHLLKVIDDIYSYVADTHNDVAKRKAQRLVRVYNRAAELREEYLAKF